MKYTLFCRPGRLFSTDLHYLYIGSWVNFSDGFIVLKHGIMTDDKLSEILIRGYVNVFSDSRFNCISIDHFYNESYYRRIVADEDLQQYCGRLVRIRKRLFAGRLSLL